MSHRFEHLEDEARAPVARKIRRPRGVQPTFNERQEVWRTEDKTGDRGFLIPDNDSECYRPEMG